MTYYAIRRSIKGGVASSNERTGDRAQMERQFHLYCASAATNADGNDFIPAALEAGAAKVIGGDGALAELQALAREYRRSLKGTKVVALTGSAGKTTTKELLKSFLSTLGKTHATAGNFNNHLGLPITVLNCPRDARFLVPF